MCLLTLIWNMNFNPKCIWEVRTKEEKEKSFVSIFHSATFKLLHIKTFQTKPGVKSAFSVFLKHLWKASSGGILKIIWEKKKRRGDIFVIVFVSGRYLQCKIHIFDSPIKHRTKRRVLSVNVGGFLCAFAITDVTGFADWCSFVTQLPLINMKWPFFSHTAWLFVYCIHSAW